MLNEVYDTIEAILECLDTGGEQSRAFAEEIKMLQDVLGYPEPATDALGETLRRCQLARKLERLAILGRGYDRHFADLTRRPMAGWDLRKRKGRRVFREVRSGAAAPIPRRFRRQRTELTVGPRLKTPIINSI
jgi:hypothetical protein